jgi:PHD/YefM family antitoxin component YafN of YafNO toxin-antitoxin module
LKNKQTITINTIPMTKARTNLGALAKRVHLNKEYIILEKVGIPIIGIMDADELEDYLELQDPKARRDIEMSNTDIRAGRTHSIDALIAEFQPNKKTSRSVADYDAIVYRRAEDPL